MANESKGPAAAYVSWTTFKKVIENLASAGVSNVIDKSLFPTMAGSVISQLLSGMKFLGLTDDDGAPSESLHGLAVQDEEQRKKALADILRARYSDLFAIGLERATPAQLDQKMFEKYGVSGETREKAVRFFLAAAVYAEVPLSPLLKAQASGARIRKTNGAKKSSPGAAPIVNAPPIPPANGTTTRGESTVVTLKDGGGSVTLTVEVALSKLKGRDREFVFSLLDQMSEYEGEPESAP